MTAAKVTHRLFLLCFFFVLLTSIESAQAQDQIGLKVPEGFKVTRYADDDLAHDIFCMTIDSLGRVVVSGPGYVRVLLDKDEDGVADQYEVFADGPEKGAQGMFFHGRDLIAAGDDGLVIYRDDDGDRKADGDPEVFLRMNTGGEHNAHAIRRGPDGWWYVVVGNTTGVTPPYASLPTSPIKKPRGGAIMRLRPELFGGEIIADGFRNSYDFAFNSQGDIFAWDSDGERDVSLPWYRPTRVFHVVPQSDAGWVSRSWKRPGYFFDMPPVVGSFGRGSPTGVECYRHHQFPKEYFGALFIQDWTFGRIWALPLRQNRDTWKATPIEFVSAKGSFGFAPTDMAVAPDGSIYISVGGRGTRGSVFKVEYTGDDKPTVPDADFESIESVLQAPQPLSAWSRAEWMSTAEILGKSKFLKAAVDPKRPPRERVRAIEVLTEMFDGLDSLTLARLIDSDSPRVRARTAWSLGRISPEKPPLIKLKPFLGDKDPLVVRTALEALVTASEPMNYSTIEAELLDAMKSKDRVLRLAASRVVRKFSSAQTKALVKKIDRRSAESVFTLLFGRTERKDKVDIGVLETCLVAMEAKSYSDDIKLLAARLFQQALGGVGPAGLPASFDGYGSVLDLVPHNSKLSQYGTRLTKVFPTNSEPLDTELARCIALVTPAEPGVISKLLDKVSSRSNPIQDIHYLLVAALLEVQRKESETARTADALLNLDPKYTKLKLNRDSNWDERIGELYRQLVRVDSRLPEAIISHKSFGRPAHVTFLSEVSKDARQTALEKIIAVIEDSDDYRWTPDVVFAVGKSTRPADLNLLRDQFDNYAVRDSVLRVLARDPQKTDRKAFVQGLSSSTLNVLADCVSALTKLGAAKDPVEIMSALKTARRLTDGTQEYRIREKVVRLLQESTGRKFGFEFDSDGYKPQPEALQRWTEFLTSEYPEAASKAGQGDSDLASVREMLTNTNWKKGDAARGAVLFEKRACARCHGARSALGPNLAGVTKRFSRDDLFTAIAAPDRDVSPRYQTEIVETSGGKVYTGLVIYHSVDGLLLRDAQNQTYRFPGREIADRRKTEKSLMPKGLLKDLKASDLADLYAYMESLE